MPAISPHSDRAGRGAITNGPTPCLRKEAAPVRAMQTVKRYLWLLPMIHNEFWISAGFALLQPFFPTLASSRAITAWQYGFVFSIYKLGMLMGSMVAERLLESTQPSICYIFGQGGFFISLLLFGSLHWIQDGAILLGTSLATAFIGGLTNNMYFVSSFTVLTTTFQRYSGFILGLNEFVWGTGNMAGSYLGGLLIDVWAFPLPFFVFGLLLAINLPIIVFYRNTLDGYSENIKTGPNAEEENLHYWRLLCDPVFLADMFTLTMEWIITGFNESTLEPSLTEFELTNAEIGMVYTAQFGCYVFGCIIAGVISNYKGDCWYMVFGQCLCCAAFLVLVPLPVLGAERDLWNVYVCQAFIGFGTSALFVCAYNHALGHAMRSGYPNNTRTNGFVSSCVFSFMVLGGIVTPPLSGLVVERRGYKLGCVFLSCFLGAWIPVTITIWIHTSCTISNSWVVKDSCKSSVQ